jgi:hypothetical protein
MKQAYLVLGPESSGTHLVADILVNAGCQGHSGNHCDWRAETAPAGVSYDDQPWDHEEPVDQTPIVWRRSVPHGGEWPDIVGWINRLQNSAYQVSVVVVVRDWHATIQSQLKWGHVKTRAKAEMSLWTAYMYIFEGLKRAKAPFVVTTYEALVNYPEAQDGLLEELGLDLPEKRPEVWDGNAKWYAEGEHISPDGLTQYIKLVRRKMPGCECESCRDLEGQHDSP